MVARRRPEDADGLACGGPGDLRGVLVTEVEHLPADEVPCPSKGVFNPYKENFGVSLHPRYKLRRKLRRMRRKEREEEDDDHEDSSSRMAAGVAIACFVVIGLAACLVCALYLRRRRQEQRYRALHDVRFRSAEMMAAAAAAEGGGVSSSGYRDTGEVGGGNGDIIRR